MTVKIKQKGALVVLVLVFGTVFFVMMAGFLRYTATQFTIQEQKYIGEQAREIAEFGINYYKWYLAHNPNDITHGTTTPGPYVIKYNDPEAGDIGEASLSIESTEYCGDVASVSITSTGYSYENPDRQRTIYARYSRPTVAEYAYIINSNVWAGSDRVIVGPYHSNGGIRMDGTNNSIVQSGQSTWNCTSSYGCDPSDSNADGVVGDGVNSDLWSFPAAPINFTGLSIDLAQMQAKAEDVSTGGIYIPSSGAYGYRLIFKADETVDVYTVDDTYTYEGYTTANGWQTERNIVKTESFYNTYTLSSGCPLIFVEDKVWLEGEVPTKVTLAVADIDTAGADHSIILQDNITYTSTSSGLLAITEEDVLIGVDVPDDMEIHGIFVAQNGRFGRNHYIQSKLPRECVSYWWWFCTGWNDPFVDDVMKNSLSVYGTVVSNGRVGTQWISGGTQISGFSNRYNSYDRSLVVSPPPLTPHTSDDYQFIEWREVE